MLSFFKSSQKELREDIDRFSIQEKTILSKIDSLKDSTDPLEIALVRSCKRLLNMLRQNKNELLTQMSIKIKS